MYKGLSHPVIGAVPINMIIFVGTEFWKKYFKEHRPDMSLFNQSLIAGSFGGLMSLSIQVPVELLKCRAQIDRNQSHSYQQQIESIV